MKFHLKAIIMPDLYFIAVSEDGSTICHIPSKDFDARHGRGKAKSLIVTGKMARFERLAFRSPPRPVTEFRGYPERRWNFPSSP